MRNPRRRGTPLDGERFAGWVERFSGYHSHVSAAEIERWLGQFTADRRDLAARILDAVEFYRPDQLAAAYRSILGALPGWSRNASQRQGHWRFIAFSIRSGESGDNMLAIFRRANNLTGTHFNALFAYKADLLRDNLGPEDTVIFVDDFAGTGDQAINAWNESLGELLPRRPRVFLVLVVAVQQALRRIANETPLRVRTFRHLRERHNFFANECVCFSPAEKRTALSYCRRADQSNPQGYGGCGLLLVMAHGCPNNSLPILHARSRDFRGLFPR
ncbi:MAG: phosphoribosyltransferase-like protein [bacterium]